MRLVAPDGSQIGVKKLVEALWLADQLGLDLVEVAPDAKPPVCRLMDYGKYKYEQSVRDREARKHQKRTVIKELRMAPRIEDHDFDINLRKALEFLEEGDKVKVTVRFRGREQERPEFGRRLLERLAAGVGENATVEQVPQQEGRLMTMVLAPSRRKRQVQVSPESNSAASAPVNEEQMPLTTEGQAENGSGQASPASATGEE
ncbi:MAG: translation initiation factor IF-3 [Acidimicrobiia bacterium]